MKEKIIKVVLFSGFLLVTSIPLIQKHFPFKEVKPLLGDVRLHSKPPLTLKDWISGKFQSEYDKYVNDNIGFRPWFVKYKNQIEYTVFNKINAKGIIWGLDNYLYEMNYIKAYNGLDFVGVDSIKSQVNKIRYLQDTLAKKGKTLMVCLASGKGSFYPKYFPQEYQKEKTYETNYHYYSQLLQENKVNLIDFNKWFLEMKDTCHCMLYPKYGIHWSYYGAVLAADSIIKFIEHKTRYNLPDIDIYKTEITDVVRDSDYDIAGGMNLLEKFPSDPMCYPKFNWKKSPDSYQPKVIIVSDSFYWVMYNMGLSWNSFKTGGFWYYNQQIFTGDGKDPLNVDEVNLKEQIDNCEVIILMATEANLFKFPFGFADKAYNIYKK